MFRTTAVCSSLLFPVKISSQSQSQSQSLLLSNLFIYQFSSFSNPSLKSSPLSQPFNAFRPSPFPTSTTQTHAVQLWRHASIESNKERKVEKAKYKKTSLQKNLFDSKISDKEQEHHIHQTRALESQPKIQKSIETILGSKHVGKRKKAILRKEKELSEDQILSMPKPTKLSEDEEPNFEKVLEDEAREELIVEAKADIIERVFREKYREQKYKSVYESPQYKKWKASKDPFKDFGEKGETFVHPTVFGYRVRGTPKPRHVSVVAFAPNSPLPFRIPAPIEKLDTSRYMIQPLLPGEQREDLNPPIVNPLPQNKRHKRLDAAEKNALQAEIQEIRRRTRPVLHLNYWITQLRILRTKHRHEIRASAKAARLQKSKERVEAKMKKRLQVSSPNPAGATTSDAPATSS